MSDHELERLRRQRLAQLSKRFLTKEEEKKEEGNKQDVLKKVFVGRAWEVFNATQTQYPEIAEKLRNILVQLASSGKITQVCENNTGLWSGTLLPPQKNGLKS